jgi:hypothetical protein
MPGIVLQASPAAQPGTQLNSRYSEVTLTPFIGTKVINPA